MCLALDAQKVSGPKLVNFKNTLNSDPAFVERVKILTQEVESFAEQFYMPQWVKIYKSIINLIWKKNI